MKLYFSPGACSMASHIALAEAGLPYRTERVDLGSKLTAGGADFTAINPKGYVPALELNDGAVLTEGPAILQYIADQVPEKHLVPPFGTLDRYHLMGWLNFISTELHKNFTPLFMRDSTDEMKAAARAGLAKRFTYLDAHLDGRDHLMGARFTVADAYLFTVANWAGFVKLDLSAYRSLRAFQERVAMRPAVQQAMGDEGLLK